MNAGVRTLVVVELTRLGDFITILPALRALRGNFPSARTYVVSSESHAPLLALFEPGIHVISVRNPGSLPGFLRALKSVREIRPDLACSMSPANRNAALSLASGAPFIVGYLNGTDSLTPFLGVTPVESIGFDGRPGVTFTSENIQDRPWKVLQAIGLNAPGVPLVNFPARIPDDRQKTRPGSTGINRPYVTIHPFSGWEYRSWPLDQFRSLAEKLLTAHPFDVVFLCHRREASRFDPLRESFRGQDRVHFVPSADITESAALIGQGELFIGNDSGPLHLAAFLGVPVVGLFGPAQPAHTAPYAARGVYLYKKVPCSPCTQTLCTMSANPCMNRISVDEVCDAAGGLLGLSRADAVALHG